VTLKKIASGTSRIHSMEFADDRQGVPKMSLNRESIELSTQEFDVIIDALELSKMHSAVFDVLRRMRAARARCISRQKFHISDLQPKDR
jgi:hypothetical protein